MENPSVTIPKPNRPGAFMGYLLSNTNATLTFRPNEGALTIEVAQQSPAALLAQARLIELVREAIAHNPPQAQSALSASGART